MKNNLRLLREKLGEKRVKKNEPLSRHTTFKVGGPADWFYEAETTADLVKAVKLCRQLKIPYFILSGGSNVLVSDNGWRGLVIKVKSAGWQIVGERIIAEPGLSLAKLVAIATRNSLAGLEFAAGIPGNLGGAVVGNAGAWGESIGEKVSRVKVLTAGSKIKWLDQKACRFNYRQSRFKKNQELILAVELRLKKGKREMIEKKVKRNLAKRQGQPKEPSAGCIFINPPGQPAGRLIEACGLKGRKIGRAQISPRHANFIVNLGRAQAEEIIRLIKLAKREVKKKFGLELQEEIKLLGFDKI